MLRILSALLALAACAPSTQPAPTAPDPAPGSPAPNAPTAAPQPGGAPPCAGDQGWYTPAGDETRITKGCYTRCDSAACPSGQVCTEVTTNPCGETETGQVKSCMAASTRSRLCLAG
jgi:hypothetical protein